MYELSYVVPICEFYNSKKKDVDGEDSRSTHNMGTSNIVWCLDVRQK